MIQKIFLLCTSLLMINCASAQLPDGNANDSLTAKSFDYLREGFESNIYEPAKSDIYAQAWLKKAKSGKANYHELALVYKAMIINADKKLRMAYADSMVRFAKRTSDFELIGSSYMTKGIVHYDRKEHMLALDNYLLADKYVSRVENPYLTHKVKYGIAMAKYYLGFYDEAISLLRECIDFFKEENDRAYLNSLHCLGLCYNKTGNYEWCTLTNQMGIDEGRKLEDTGMEFYFIHSEGINQCCKKNYTAAIKKLTAALPGIISLKDFANESVAYFYIGKSYWQRNQYDQAITYFKKVDHIFQKENYTRPDLREAYELLIGYYKKQNDTKLQLFYINQLLKVDQSLAKNYRYLLQKIVKEYDTKELISEKESIEQAIYITRTLACAVVVLMALIIAYLTRRNNRNKKLFEELMKRDTSVPAAIETEIPNDEDVINSNPTRSAENNTGKYPVQDISPDIETAIVKKLEKFELNKKYLEKDMTLSKMATILHTNSKYVTKVVAKYRDKGTIEYITDLKLDYIIHVLKTQSKYRNYTNKALGEEAGFGSTQNFTRAFKTKTGISPTYFIYKLKKSAGTDDSQ
ncbi:MAG: AraC family transcriptional regulator [Flavobacterium sp.]